MNIHKTNEKNAKQEVQDAVDIALLKKIPTLKDDRTVPLLKARVKNSNGDPVVVKIRALMPGDDPGLATKLAEVTAKRRGLPDKAVSKLTKHLLAFSTKKTNYSAKVCIFFKHSFFLFFLTCFCSFNVAYCVCAVCVLCVCCVRAVCVLCVCCVCMMYIYIGSVRNKG